MASNKSAKKRIGIANRNRFRNRVYQSSVKTLIKKFLISLDDYKISKNLSEKEKLKKTLSSIYSLIDKATQKNVFHKNKAARKKSQLSTQLKEA